MSYKFSNRRLLAAYRTFLGERVSRPRLAPVLSDSLQLGCSMKREAGGEGAVRLLGSAPSWTALALTLVAQGAAATNGMNLEAYGATAGGLGGAAFAYDTGNSAVMNNPATLGLRRGNGQNFGLGLTLLSPNVKASGPATGTVESDGTAYWMPSISYIRRQGDLSFGAALLAQGGMGTEYGSGSPLFARGLPASGVGTVPLSGQEIRSEVSFGRVLLPLVWSVSERLSLAGQLDLVWGGMDLRMDMDGQTVAGLMGAGRVSGGLAGALGGLGDLHYARFDFSDDSPVTGQARGYGSAWKLGGVFQVNPQLSVGATYHARTRIGDMKAANARMMAAGDTNADGVAEATASLNGEISVINFQWPEIYGVGLAWTPNATWMLAADIKRIRWSETMKDFHVRFTDAASGQSLEVSMPQDWSDQTVVALGVQYQASHDLALRFGVNYGKNPVPDATLSPLFPAIVETHYTLGVGYHYSTADTLAAALTYAPEVETQNPAGVQASHGQISLRINYNHSF